jgi:hypothetical protein
MGPFACDECRAIYDEMRNAARPSQAAATAQPLADWIRDLDREECARLRQSSELWRAWRRFQAHRASTGHWPGRPFHSN